MTLAVQKPECWDKLSHELCELLRLSSKGSLLRRDLAAAYRRAYGRNLALHGHKLTGLLRGGSLLGIEVDREMVKLSNVSTAPASGGAIRTKSTATPPAVVAGAVVSSVQAAPTSSSAEQQEGAAGLDLDKTSEEVATLLMCNGGSLSVNGVATAYSRTYRRCLRLHGHKLRNLLHGGLLRGIELDGDTVKLAQAVPTSVKPHRTTVVKPTTSSAAGVASRTTAVEQQRHQQEQVDEAIWTQVAEELASVLMSRGALPVGELTSAYCSTHDKSMRLDERRLRTLLQDGSLPGIQLNGKSVKLAETDQAPVSTTASPVASAASGPANDIGSGVTDMNQRSKELVDLLELTGRPLLLCEIRGEHRIRKLVRAGRLRGVELDGGTLKLAETTPAAPSDRAPAPTCAAESVAEPACGITAGEDQESAGELDWSVLSAELVRLIRSRGGQLLRRHVASAYRRAHGKELPLCGNTLKEVLSMGRLRGIEYNEEERSVELTGADCGRPSAAVPLDVASCGGSPGAPIDLADGSSGAPIDLVETESAPGGVAQGQRGGDEQAQTKHRPQDPSYHPPGKGNRVTEGHGEPAAHGDQRMLAAGAGNIDINRRSRESGNHRDGGSRGNSGWPETAGDLSKVSVHCPGGSTSRCRATESGKIPGGRGGVLWLAEDDGIPCRRDHRGSRGSRDDGDVYCRPAKDSGGSSVALRGRHGGTDGESDRGGGGGVRRAGKSCPPPRAEKERFARDGGVSSYHAVVSPKKGGDDVRHGPGESTARCRTTESGKVPGGRAGVLWLEEDDGIPYRRDHRRSRGSKDDGDVYCRPAKDSGGSSVALRGRHGGTDGESNRGGGGGVRRAGKSCPPPRAEKERFARDGGVSSYHVVVSPEKGEDDALAEITNQMVALELAAGNREASGVDRAYFLLEEYKAAAVAGEIKPYKGTKYKTVDDRYADGWAYNPTTSRWIKVACQQKKAAIEAHPALIARLEMLESKVKLSTQRSQLLETKAEKILMEQTTRPTVTLTMPTAPELIVFDTNWLMNYLADTKRRVADMASHRTEKSILIPKEVLRELDRLKTNGTKDETTRRSARKANEYLRSLLEKPLKNGREFPVVRGQQDTELYRDDGYHKTPCALRGDDSILNCCMFFTQGVKTPRKVTLCTGDNNFAVRARSNGLSTESRPQCAQVPCPVPLGTVPSRQPSIARSYYR